MTLDDIRNLVYNYPVGKLLVMELNNGSKIKCFIKGTRKGQTALDNKNMQDIEWIFYDNLDNHKLNQMIDIHDVKSITEFNLESK